MSIVSKVLRFFIKPDTNVIIGELHRNDKCYCNSNLKFKNCHATELIQKKLTAYIVEDIQTKKKFIKIMQNDKSSSASIKSNLRWEDIGGGGSGKIDP